MNKSKIIAASGLATVMSATAATADSVSLNGYIEGWFTSGDNTTGMNNSYVDFLQENMNPINYKPRGSKKKEDK